MSVSPSPSPPPARPVVRWVQNRTHVTLTVETGTAQPSTAVLCISADKRTVCVQPGILQDLTLYRALAQDVPDTMQPTSVSRTSVTFKLPTLCSDWPRLTLQKTSEAPAIISCDWSRWADSDADTDADDAGNFGGGYGGGDFGEGGDDDDGVDVDEDEEGEGDDVVDGEGEGEDDC